AVVRVPQATATIEVRGADVTARPAVGDLDVSGRIDTFVVDAFGRREQLDRVAVDGRLSVDVIAIKRIAWRWQGEAMQVAGELRRPWADRRELALRAKGEIALGPLARAAGVDQQVTGTAQVAADLTGPVATPSIAARIRIPELRMATFAARDVAIDGR